MLRLLIWTRVRMLWNTARASAPRHRLLAAGLGLLGLLLFAGLYLTFRGALALAPPGPPAAGLVRQIFFLLFLFLLAGAVPFVASTLLHSADYALLGAAPVSPRVVVAAKLLDATVTNATQFLVIGLPAILAAGSALLLPAPAWAALPPLVLLFVLLPSLLTALLLMAALSALGMRRVRAAIAAVNGVMALTVCLTIVAQTSELGLVGGLAAMHGHAPLAMSGHPPLTPGTTASLSPSTWFADVLVALAGPSPAGAAAPAAAILLTVAGLLAACLALGDRLLHAAALAEEGAGRVVMGARWTARSAKLLAPLAPPIAGLIRKDVRYILRDSVLMGQLAMPLILFCVPFLLGVQSPYHRALIAGELYPFAAMMVATILFMQSSILALSILGLEGRAFWLLLTSPNGGAAVLWSKWLAASAVSGAAAIALTTAAAFAFRGSAPQAAAHAAILALASTGLCGIGVGISAALPRFIYENPAHRVSAWALILGFCGSVLYVGLGGGVLGAAALAAARAPEQAAAIWAAGAALFALLTAVAAVAPMVVGAARISRYQWRH
ncbi:MAG: hypothetical protein IT208_06660 [Chthonomonadales bacterium]|nr:hypothetical protein [Chthonomonadales bacterium]